MTYLLDLQTSGDPAGPEPRIFSTISFACLSTLSLAVC